MNAPYMYDTRGLRCINISSQRQMPLCFFGALITVFGVFFCSCCVLMCTSDTLFKWNWSKLFPVLQLKCILCMEFLKPMVDAMANSKLVSLRTINNAGDLRALLLLERRLVDQTWPVRSLLHAYKLADAVLALARQRAARKTKPASSILTSHLDRQGSRSRAVLPP